MVSFGDVDGAARLVEVAGDPNARRLRLWVASANTVVAEARGELEEAAARCAWPAPGWVDDGFGLEEAWVPLGFGRCLKALGRRDEARTEFERARELADELGALPIMAEVDASLEGAPAR